MHRPPKIGSHQTMPPTDAPLERLVHHAVEAMHLLELWLFGSRAENRARPASDYDLLVVMPDGTLESELDRASLASRMGSSRHRGPHPVHTQRV
jgi:predicted nucleotidyltransferase